MIFRKLCTVNGRLDTNRMWMIRHTERELDKNFTSHQRGGEIITLKYENERYSVNTDSGLFSDSDRNDLIISFVTMDCNHKCAMLIINKDEKEAIIQDVSNHEDCMKDETDKSPPKIGYKFVRLLIKIARKHGMKTISLHDASKFICLSGSRVDLLKARTLIEGYLYYTKFGFEPAESIDRPRMEQNAETISKLLVKDIFWDKILNDSIIRNYFKGSDILFQVKETVLKNLNTPLSSATITL